VAGITIILDRARDRDDAIATVQQRVVDLVVDTAGRLA
jgi:hypothetical protein